MGAIANWVDQYKDALEDEGFDIEALISFDCDLEQIRQEYYDQGWSDGYEAAMEERSGEEKELHRGTGRSDGEAVLGGRDADEDCRDVRHHADNG